MTFFNVFYRHDGHPTAIPVIHGAANTKTETSTKETTSCTNKGKKVVTPVVNITSFGQPFWLFVNPIPPVGDLPGAAAVPKSTSLVTVQQTTPQQNATPDVNTFERN